MPHKPWPRKAAACPKSCVSRFPFHPPPPFFAPSHVSFLLAFSAPVAPQGLPPALSVRSCWTPQPNRHAFLPPPCTRPSSAPPPLLTPLVFAAAQSSSPHVLPHTLSPSPRTHFPLLPSPFPDLLRPLRTYLSMPPIALLLPPVLLSVVSPIVAAV